MPGPVLECFLQTLAYTYVPSIRRNLPLVFMLQSLVLNFATGPWEEHQQPALAEDRFIKYQPWTILSTLGGQQGCRGGQLLYNQRNVHNVATRRQLVNLSHANASVPANQTWLQTSTPRSPTLTTCHSYDEVGGLPRNLTIPGYAYAFPTERAHIPKLESWKRWSIARKMNFQVCF